MLWDTAHLSAPPLRRAVPGGIGSVAFQPGGPGLAAGTSRGIYLWSPPFNTAEPRLVPGSTNPGDTIYYPIAFSPDGNRLVGGSTRGVQVYDLRNPQAPSTVLATYEARAVAFSADGDQVAANSDHLRIWSLGQPPAPPVVLPSGSSDGPAPLAFSPDGRFLAAGNGVQIWDLQRLPAVGGTATPVRTLEGQCLVYALAFSPDGKRLAGGCYETAARLWDLSGLAQGASAETPGSTLLSAVDVPADLSYSLAWQWSRFNEDFGTIQAPPTGTPTVPAPPTPPTPVPTAPTPAPPAGMPSTGGVAPARGSLLLLIVVVGLGTLLAGGWIYRASRRRTRAAGM